MPLSQGNSPPPGPSHRRPVDILPSGEVAAEAPISIDVVKLLGFPVADSRYKSRSQSRLRDVIWDEDRSDTESNHSTTNDPTRPWYRRPSPWWILPTVTLSALVATMTVAPRTEVYIRLVCAELKPEYVLYPSPVPPINATIPLPIDITSSPHGEYVIFPRDVYPTSNTAVQFKVPRPSAKCASDSEIGARVARLATAVTFVLGFLAFITTGWWAKLSDKAGRTRVLGLGTLGIIASDINFIMVTLHAHRLAGGYNLLILGSAADGIMGGVFTFAAAAHAYVSDCADPSARAQMFSLYSGMVFVGMAFGPTLGGLLITATEDLLSVFYMATAGHLIIAIIIWFFMPESLSGATKAKIAERQKHVVAANVARRERRAAAGGSVVLRAFRDVFSFLEPLEIFIPRKRVVGEPGRGRDWDLMALAFAHFVSSSLVGTTEYKFQYAASVFNWSSEQLGYWLTAIGIVRSIYLILLLPLIYQLLGPQRSNLRDSDVPSDDSTRPLLDSAPPTDPPAGTASRDLSLTPSHDQRVTHRHAYRTAAFDLRVAKVSAFVDLLSYLLICIVSGPALFTVTSCMASFGAGFGPGVQSLALALMPRGGEDAGKLFGALALLSALSGQIIGPTLFGATYIATVATFPKAIFLLSAVLLLGTTGTLFFIRLPRHRLFPSAQ